MPRHNGNTQPGERRRWQPQPDETPPGDELEALAVALVTSGRRAVTILDNPRSVVRAMTAKGALTCHTTS